MTRLNIHIQSSTHLKIFGFSRHAEWLATEAVLSAPDQPYALNEVEYFVDLVAPPNTSGFYRRKMYFFFLRI